MWTKNNIPDQSGKTVIVTGANAGIGFETALALYEAGAHVILACRSLDNADQAAAKIKLQNGKGSLKTAQLDLSNLASVKQFAEDFIKSYQQLNILINNAGVMIPPASKTADGFELQFGVNFIGHYALTGLLYPLLKVTPESRIVTLSSLAYLHGVINFDNLYSEIDYNAMREYGQSKLADVIFAIELQKRITAAGDDVLSLSAQPGANRTELARHMDQVEFNSAVDRIGGLMDPWQGALPSLYAATEKDVNIDGIYEPDDQGGYRGYPTQTPFKPHALDKAVNEKLWAFAEKVTGVHFPA